MIAQVITCMRQKFAEILPDHKISLQDITKDYIQGQDLQHDVYLKPFHQFELSQ